MNKYLIILAITVLVFASCGGRGQKKVAAADNSDTIPRITVTIRDNIPGKYCSGVVILTVPLEYYEILVPGLDTIRFSRFDPQPHWHEYEPGYEGERERDWAAQIDFTAYSFESLGAVVGEDGTIVTAAAYKFYVQEINVQEVQEYFMEYMLSGEWWRNKTKFADGEMEYDKEKLANLKAQDIQVSKKGGGDITVRFFRKRVANLIEINPPTTDTVKYYLQDTPPYKAELIGHDEHIALVQLASRTLPHGTVVFDISDAEKKPSPNHMQCIRMLTKYGRPREYLAVYGNNSEEPLYIYGINNTTNIFNYGSFGGQIGSPLIDTPQGNLVGLDIGGNTKFTVSRWVERESNRAISAGEIHERIQQWLR